MVSSEKQLKQTDRKSDDPERSVSPDGEYQIVHGATTIDSSGQKKSMSKIVFTSSTPFDNPSGTSSDNPSGTPSSSNSPNKAQKAQIESLVPKVDIEVKLAPGQKVWYYDEDSVTSITIDGKVVNETTKRVLTVLDEITIKIPHGCEVNDGCNAYRIMDYKSELVPKVQQGKPDRVQSERGINVPIVTLPEGTRIRLHGIPLKLCQEMIVFLPSPSTIIPNEQIRITLDEGTNLRPTGPNNDQPDGTVMLTGPKMILVEPTVFIVHLASSAQSKMNNINDPTKVTCIA